MFSLLRYVLLALTLIATAQSASIAAIHEVGDLNIIDDARNASDGLGYLDLSITVGLTELQALTAAQARHSDARLATASEWDDLFAADGFDYSSDLTAGDAWETGVTAVIGSAGSGFSIQSLLGTTSEAGSTIIWSSPDGSASEFSTRDYLRIDNAGTAYVQQSDIPAPYWVVAWLFVTDPATAAVPEASAILVWFGLGTIGFLKRQRHRGAM